MKKFKAKATQRGFIFYEQIKSFFGKEKLKEVSPIEVFSPLMFSGNLFPNIENMTLDTILWIKQEFNLKNHLSDFNCTVKFKIVRYEDDIVETDDKYNGDVSFDGIMYNELTNEEICSFTINTRVIDSEHKPTKEYYEALFSATYSGKFNSLEKMDKLYDTFLTKTDRWVCDECGQTFSNRLEFLSHLMESKHYDTIFEQYINDKDVMYVKNSRERD